MLAALSQPARLKVVQFAAEKGAEGAVAGDIARALDCPASTLSFHLKALAGCGLLQATPQGRYIRYAVRPAAFAALAQFIRDLPGPPAGKGGAEARAAGRRGARKGRAPAAPGDDQLPMFGD